LTDSEKEKFRILEFSAHPSTENKPSGERQDTERNEHTNVREVKTNEGIIATNPAIKRLT
jgi:hypothetical protein